MELGMPERDGAWDYLAEILGDGAGLVVHTYRVDAYSRFVANLVRPDGSVVNDEVLEEAMAGIATGCGRP